MDDQNAFYAEVGSLIRRAREARGLTQQALASLASLTRVSVTNIEMGRQKIMLHTLVDFAAALKVAPGELLPTVTHTNEHMLDELLRDRQPDEQEWILSAMRPTKKKRKGGLQ